MSRHPISPSTAIGVDCQLATVSRSESRAVGTVASHATLVAGRVAIMFDAAPSLMPFITAGKLRVLAAASSERHRLLPDVPSFAELGLPAMNIALWYGIVAPGQTPRPVVQRLSTELMKILDMPDIRKSLIDQGADPKGGTPDEFAAFMQAEQARWGPVVKDAGIKPE